MTQRFSVRKTLSLTFTLTLINALSVLPWQAACAQSADSSQQYEVELLVFSLTRPSASAEDWAFEETLGPANEGGVSDEEHAGTVGSATLSSATPSNVAYQTFPALDPSQLRMASVAASLQKNSAYKIVAHFAWKQPGKSNDTAIPISVSGFVADGTPLSGTVTLIHSKFIHLKVNLAYRAADGHRYVLREQRRMQRPGEKHYLDHPFFGVIALVTPSN